MQGHKKISVVIPAYNEEATLSHVIEGVYESLRQQDYEFEVIVVDDGSTDNTSEVAKNAGALVIKHVNNKGHAAALKSAFRVATGNIIVMLDADGQHNPFEIPKLLRPVVNNEADLVIGSRYLGGESGFGFYREVLDKFFLLLIRVLTGIKLTDSQSMFRAIKQQALKKLTIHTNYTMSGEMIIKAKKQRLRIKEVPIRVSKRKYGSSYVNFLYPIRVITIMLRSLLK